MMKSVIGNSPWMQDIIPSLSRPRQLSDGELDQNHRHITTIHRKAEICDGDMKRSLGRARSNPREFNKTTESNDRQTWAVDMDTSKMGLSCSRECNSHNYVVGSFVYPYELLEINIPANLISRHGNSVYICGEECLTMVCYKRDIPPLTEKTVRKALECHGKDDSFLIDGNFSCYWDSSEHCTLCLRNSIPYDISIMDVDARDKSITFNSPFFDRIAWKECDYLGVKLSTLFVELALKNSLLAVELEKMAEKKQSLVLALLVAFNAASIDATEENAVINDAISSVFHSSSLDELSAEQTETIIQIIDMYEGQIYGWETSEWSEKLRPFLSHDDGK